ncbi:MAG: TIGR01777 family oxidoreductase [Saprospiraceae bacterium]
MQKKHVLIAGATGLIGNALVEFYLAHGACVSILTRKIKVNESKYRQVMWNLDKGFIETFDTKPDIIINLTGANIGEKRWTKKRKKELINSRVKSTELIYQWLCQKSWKIETYVTASGLGFFGDCGKISRVESDPPGTDFLSEICVAWELAAKKLHGTVAKSVSTLRFGIVLSPDGALISRMTPLSFLCVYPYFGTGSQMMPWIHIDDVVKIVDLSTTPNDEIKIYNVCSGVATTQKEFVETIAKVKCKSFLSFPIPEFVVKILLGEMSVLMLSGQNAVPRQLQNDKYTYSYNNLKDAIEHCLVPSRSTI